MGRPARAREAAALTTRLLDGKLWLVHAVIVRVIDGDRWWSTWISAGTRGATTSTSALTGSTRRNGRTGPAVLGRRAGDDLARRQHQTLSAGRRRWCLC